MNESIKTIEEFSDAFKGLAECHGLKGSIEERSPSSCYIVLLFPEKIILNERGIDKKVSKVFLGHISNEVSISYDDYFASLKKYLLRLLPEIRSGFIEGVAA